MQGWHTTFLGMRGLPRDISDFEMKAFFTFDGAERDAINARRGDSHKLGLALHIGFLRMSGRLLGAFRVIPVALWRHLGNELGIAAPEVASLRAMYERGRTLFDHQQVACTVLGFQWMSEHQRRSLVRELRDEVARCADRDQLLVRARQWLYKNKLVIVHERAIRTLIAAALAQLEVETGTAIAASVDPATLDRWRASVSELRPDGVLSRNRRKFRQPINVACPAPGRWGRPNSRVTSRHFDHGNASRTSRPDCSGLDEAD